MTQTSATIIDFNAYGTRRHVEPELSLDEAHEIAKLTASQVGTHKGGYFSFQPLWDWITAEEPDLFN